MIRIDEIYNNIFVKSMQDRRVTMHWFYPFGTTEYKNLCAAPITDDLSTRILFWDQEPLYKDRVTKTLGKFLETFQDPVIVITSEKNSEQVSWMCDTYGVKSGYYFFHGWAALDWYRGYNRTFLYQPFRDRNPVHTFLCPNNIIGGKRRHRLDLLSELVDRELILDNLISFPAICPYENRTVADLCTEYEIFLGDVELPLTIDRGARHADDSHRIDMWSLADQSLLHVVTETVYHGRRQHLTEKSFKPIVMQQPFVLVSCQGSLEYLRSYGFKTFGEFWNEDYDEYDDDVRIMRIGKLLNDLHIMSQTEKKQLQKYLVPIVEHNFRWFYSRDFENLLWSELTDMIKQW
jgi:hypothetical protein